MTLVSEVELLAPHHAHDLETGRVDVKGLSDRILVAEDLLAGGVPQDAHPRLGPDVLFGEKPSPRRIEGVHGLIGRGDSADVPVLLGCPLPAHGQEVAGDRVHLFDQLGARPHGFGVRHRQPAVGELHGMG